MLLVPSSHSRDWRGNPWPLLAKNYISHHPPGQSPLARCSHAGARLYRAQLPLPLQLTEGGSSQSQPANALTGQSQPASSTPPQLHPETDGGTAQSTWRRTWREANQHAPSESDQLQPALEKQRPKSSRASSQSEREGRRLTAGVPNGAVSSVQSAQGPPSLPLRPRPQPRWVATVAPVREHGGRHSHGSRGDQETRQQQQQPPRADPPPPTD